MGRPRTPQMNQSAKQETKHVFASTAAKESRRNYVKTAIGFEHVVGPLFFDDDPHDPAPDAAIDVIRQASDFRSATVMGTLCKGTVSTYLEPIGVGPLHKGTVSTYLAPVNVTIAKFCRDNGIGVVGEARDPFDTKYRASVA